MDQQLETAELIDEILNDPDAQVEDARLLLARRRNLLFGIERNVIARMKVYGSMFRVAPDVPVLRDMTNLLAAIHDLAVLDSCGRSPGVSAERKSRAIMVAQRCEIAIARLQSFLQHHHAA